MRFCENKDIISHPKKQDHLIRWSREGYTFSKITINGHLLSLAETDAKLSCIIALDILNTKSPICTCAT